MDVSFISLDIIPYGYNVLYKEDMTKCNSVPAIQNIKTHSIQRAFNEEGTALYTPLSNATVTDYCSVRTLPVI